MLDYSYLLHTASAGKWQKIGTSRRAGIAVPLFSIFSNQSIGIGDIWDISLLVEWCKKTGISIIQLLPLNETGIDNAPYNAISTFAIEPIYINLNKLKYVDINQFQLEIKSLKNRFPQRKLRVNYRIKGAKIGVLRKIYSQSSPNGISGFKNFKEQNQFWINEYALYKAISSNLKEFIWEKWPDKLKLRNPDALKKFESENEEEINFYKWIQWQLYEQLREVKKYANENGINIMGDLPFLVSRNSADVWSQPEYFQTDFSAGAPPDMYFALGQKWGMPPYNWYKIAEDGFKYLGQRLAYAENFYNMFRIDHFVGLFRVWTIALNTGAEEAASRGRYEPSDESLWEEHGKAIINVMLKSASMLPCAEDLGTVPPCSYKVLYEYGIPGIDFQRYLKDPGNNFNFKTPFDYRVNSAAVTSTHDSSFFFNWWKYEAGTMDEKLFELLCIKQGMDSKQISGIKKELFDRKLSKHRRLYWKDEINSRDLFLSILHPWRESENSFSYAYYDSYGEKQKFLHYLEYYNTHSDVSMPSLIKKCLEKINSSASIFSIQLLQEYLALDETLFRKMDRWSYRINIPGTVGRSNWSVLMPCSLEEMMELPINEPISEMLRNSGRI